MLDSLKQIVGAQFEAAFCTLQECVARCPAASWNAPVGNNPFCQVVFHALFFADYYLERSEDSFLEQAFHRENAAFFGDYEQLEDREPRSLYDRASIEKYLSFCRDKAAAVIAAETEESLRGPSGFARRKISRGELHLVNIRHLQHHAAQLSLRLRIDAGVEVPWVESGWRAV